VLFIKCCIVFFFSGFIKILQTFYTLIDADIATYDISTYQRRLTAMPFVPGTSYTLAILGANGVGDKFFLAILFNNIDVRVQFLKDVGLLRGSVVCCKCGFLISWCVAAKCDLSLQPVGGLHVHYMFAARCI